MSTFEQRVARKLKHPDHVRASWVETVVGRDRHGEWAVLPAGAPVHRESGTVLRYQSHQLFWYPHDRWWVARLGSPGMSFRAHRADGTVRTRENLEPVRVDISTPPVVSAGGVAFVDLTLDVVRASDGSVTILDEDEVDEDAARWAIPAAHVTRARHACDEVAGMMRACLPPFDGSAERWLDAFADSRPQS